MSDSAPGEKTNSIGTPSAVECSLFIEWGKSRYTQIFSASQILLSDSLNKQVKEKTTLCQGMAIAFAECIRAIKLKKFEYPLMLERDSLFIEGYKHWVPYQRVGCVPDLAFADFLGPSLEEPILES